MARALTLLAVSAALLAGCGGDDEKTTSTAATPVKAEQLRIEHNGITATLGVQHAQAQQDPISGLPVTYVTLDAAGKREFERVTGDLAAEGGQFTLLVGDRVVSQPQVAPGSDPFPAARGVQIPAVPGLSANEMAEALNR